VVDASTITSGGISYGGGGDCKSFASLASIALFVLRLNRPAGLGRVVGRVDAESMFVDGYSTRQQSGRKWQTLWWPPRKITNGPNSQK
jgi:hypothetical protein